MQGTKDIAQRIVNAEDSFVDSVMEQFGKTKEEAEKVLSVFKEVKAVKIDPILGAFKMTSGLYWDAEVIDNAVNY